MNLCIRSIFTVFRQGGDIVSIDRPIKSRSCCQHGRLFCILPALANYIFNLVEIDRFNRVGCEAVQSRLTNTTRFITIGNSLIARTVVNKVRCIGVFDRAAIRIVELPRLCVCEVVRCKRGRGDGQSHSRDSCEGDFFSIYSPPKNPYGKEAGKRLSGYFQSISSMRTA